MDMGRFFYNWASDIFMLETENLEHDPKDYLESMGWDADEFKFNPDRMNYTDEDVKGLADLFKKYWPKAMKEEKNSPADATMAVMDENEVSDYLVNTMAKRIRIACGM